VAVGNEFVVIVSGPEATVSPVLLVTEPSDAEMVVLPVASAVARPEAFTTAIAVFDDVHVACAVRSFVVLSEYVPVAVSCWVPPTVTVGFAGAIAIDTSVEGAIVTETACEAAPRLPLSSTARARSVVAPTVFGVKT